MKRDLSLIVLGVLFGAVFMNIYLSGRVDSLLIERSKMRVELYETNERLKKMEAQWQSHRTTLIREIQIHFEEEPANQFLQLSLRRAVFQLAQDLVGEEVEAISPSLAVNLLDRRIIEADGNRYRIAVKTVVLAEKLTYFLSYAPLNASADDEP